MHMPQSLPALATLAIILWYMVTVFQVGRARSKYKVAAPRRRWAIPGSSARSASK